jgi:hypothetical protein
MNASSRLLSLLCYIISPSFLARQTGRQSAAQKPGVYFLAIESGALGVNVK